ncbi:LysM peptidoglycan-binding domain-containing protein [Pelomonas sp. Root1217]|uniref:LysM peptidoglycan-binding domain-containing protein n=1 Tax=Pelomonas sp. Root1217 TaxID=1736430 RepID=UPI001F3E8976|nr:LysM peptidoglycan-binding domain-containing protein [Pelomonas sp. Root1217]
MFIYEKGTSRASGLAATIVEPTTDWQSVRAEFAVLRAANLPPGQTVSYIDNMEEIPPLNGRVTQFSYDAAGRQRFAVDAEGYVTETRYDDANARMTTLRYASRLNGSSSYTPAAFAPALNTLTAALPGLGAATSVIRELDRAGRLSVETDGNGVQTQFTYDAAGQLETEVLASNVVGQASTTRYAYNGAGQRISITRADGTALASTTRYEYDAQGRLWHEIDPRGVALAEGTGAWEQAERVRLGYATDLSTLAADAKAAAQTALRKLYTTDYGYDAAGRVTTVTDALGGVTATDYDAFGRASVITDARGFKRYQVYDKTGRLLQSVDAQRYLTAYGYDAFGNLTSSLRVDAKVQGTLSGGQAVVLATSAQANGAYVLTNATADALTSRTYDRNGRLLKETDAENYLEGSDALDAFGQRLSVKNKLGATVTYTYDRLGRLLTETLPVQAKDGTGALKDVVNEYQYDSRGNRIVSIEAKGLTEQRTTQMAYDANDRLVRRIGMSYTATAADGSTSTVTPADAMRYDARGNLIEQVSHGQLQADGLTVNGGRRSVAWYDALNQKTLEISADRVASRASYDAAGNQIMQTVYATRIADGVTLDPVGSAPAVTADTANDRTLRTLYDALNRKTQTSLDNLYAWSSGDGTNLVISGLTPLNTVLQSFFYDAVGNLTERKDGRDNSSFEYFDGNGRRTLSIDAGGAAIAWEYGHAGNVATKQTRYAAMLPGGYARQANKLASAGATNDPAQLIPVITGQFVPTGEQNRITEVSLDRLDRVTEQRLLNVAQDTIDASGTRTQSTTTAITRYQYNGLGAVTQTQALAAEVGTTLTWEQTDISYDSLGRETRREAPGYRDFEGADVRPTTDTEYDGLGQVKRRIQRGKDTTVETDDRVTLSGYDANGLLVQTTDAAGAITTYAYDASGNLSRRVNKDVRRSDSTASAPKLRDIITSYEFDAAGRIVVEKHWESDKAAAAETRKTRYNAFGEFSAKGIGDGWEEFAEYSTLGKVVKTNAGDGAIKFYVYDANGNQTREIRGNGDATYKVAGLDVAIDLRSLTLQQATSGKRNPADTAFLPLYSRVSVYNSRNLITQTIDPQIDVLKSAVTMGGLYNEQWVPTWTPPTPTIINETIIPQGAVTATSGASPRLNISVPGVRMIAWDFSHNVPSTDSIWPPFYAFGSDSFSIDLSAFKGKGEQLFSYSTDAPRTLGRGRFTVDAQGTVSFSFDPQFDTDRFTGSISVPGEPAYVNPGQYTQYKFSVTDEATGQLLREGQFESVYGQFAGQISLWQLRPTGSQPSPRVLQIQYSTPKFTIPYAGGGSATMRVLFYKDGTISYSQSADPLKRPVTLTIKGRQAVGASLTFAGRDIELPASSSVYTPATATTPAYTTFTFDAASYVGTSGIYSYDLRPYDGMGRILRDEAGVELTQSGRIVFDATGGKPPQVQQLITVLSNQPSVTIKRFQSFNAFGDVVEERDERVAERMLAAINDDRKSKSQSALTALTADQLASAKTTLQYNTLGQLIAKLDPETFVTAENGYRYRARPETRFGYDLLGRHTTMLDANGNLSRVQYLAGSRGDDALVVNEFDAAGGNADAYNATGGGIRTSQYDIFGDARKITDAEGAVTERNFDRRGLLTTVTRKGVQRLANATTGALDAGRDLSDSYAYDELGQRLTATNALNITTRTDYDALQRVVQTVSGSGFITGYTYELRQAGATGITSVAGAGGAATITGGYVRTTLQADGRSLIDKVDYFGHTTWHQDLSGAQFTYTFNSAAQLVKQTSTVHTGQSAAQSVDYTYYANGYIRSFTDNTQGITSEYAYDNAGNRVAEGTFSLVNGTKATAYQNATITYDELNRISRVRDANFFDVAYEFDAVGNRRRITATYWDGLAGLLGGGTQDYWYAYDKLNRFTVSKGRLETSVGVATTARGTSAGDTGIVIKRGTEGTLLGYDKVSQRRLATYNDPYLVAGAQTVSETYTYSQDGYLLTTAQTTAYINGLVATRKVDDVGRTTLLTDIFNHQSTQSTYDNDNRLLTQSFVGDIRNLSDTSKNYTVTYSYYKDKTDATTSQTGTGALASVVQQPAANIASAFATTTTYKYDYWDDAKQTVITKYTANQNTANTLKYDVNGHLKSNTDAGTGQTQSYRTNANGQVLQRTSGSMAHYFYYADGHRIGDVGNTPEDKLRVSYAEQLHRKGFPETADQRRERYKRPSPATSADFDQNYEPINDSYPGSAAGSYTVRQDGETLRTIAQSLWGDSSLWYVIAEANGLLGDGALKAGQVLVIPNKVTNIHNNSQTWRPYSAGEAIGAVDPNWSEANMAGFKKLGEDIQRSIGSAMNNLAMGNWMMQITEQAASMASANLNFFYAMKGIDARLDAAKKESEKYSLAPPPPPPPSGKTRLGNPSGPRLNIPTGEGSSRYSLPSGSSGLAVNQGGFWSSAQTLTSGYSFSASLGFQLAGWGSDVGIGGASVAALEWRGTAQSALGNALGDSMVANAQSDVNSSKALDQFDAETARLTRYQEAAPAADDERGMAFRNGVPPRAGMKFTDYGWQYIDGNAPGGYGDQAVLAANQAVTKQVGPGQFKHVMPDGHTVYDASPYAPPTEESRRVRDQLQERYEVERTAENTAVRAATYSRFQSFAEDMAARKVALPLPESLRMSSMEKAHLFLDGVNLLADGPFALVGAFAGIVDAGLYFYEGKNFDAGLSLAGAVPLLGATFSVGRSVVRMGDDLASGLVAARVTDLGREGHALVRHGGSVTNEQLFTRAVTGVAPDGSVALASNGLVRLPPSSSAFYSDQLLAQSDLLIRNKYLDQAIAFMPPGATRVVIEAVDTGTVVGRGYDRVISTVGGVGPLRYHDSLTHVQGVYDYHAQSGTWLTITIFPVRK